MKRNYQKDGRNRIACKGQVPFVYGCQQNLFVLDPLVHRAKEEQKTADNYVFDILDTLSAPVLTYSQSWADTIPKRILDIIQMARLKALMKKHATATYAECVVYIYTRTLEAPMDSDWTDIYTHVTCKTLEEWFNEDHWADTGAPRELNDWLLSKLNGLRHHIYDKRRQAFKLTLKGQGQEESKAAKMDLKKVANLQPDFGFKDF